MAIVLISFLLSVSLGVTLMTIDNLRRSSDALRSKEAELAAESALETAKLVIAQEKNKGNGSQIGMSTDRTPVTISTPTTGQTPAGSGVTATYKIDGTASSLPTHTIDSKYIIPLPWTGDTPWTGEGSKKGGGCDPYQPPVEVKNFNATGSFKYNKLDIKGAITTETDSILLNHPCNWNKIVPGQQVEIPLFGKDGNKLVQKLEKFTIKVRTPCAPDNSGKAPEYCLAGDRWKLNCFDKGEEGVKCGEEDTTTKPFKKGEVIFAWEIEGENISGSVLTFQNDLSEMDNRTGYKPNNSLIYEGLVNGILTSTTNQFAVFKSFRSPVIKGIIAQDQTKPSDISTFFSQITKPVLKLSVVKDLVGCRSKTDQNFDGCKIDSQPTSPLPKIPYLEYQIDFGDDGIIPTNTANIITVEGTSGPFTHRIQAAIPNSDDQPDYVFSGS